MPYSQTGKGYARPGFLALPTRPIRSLVATLFVLYWAPLALSFFSPQKYVIPQYILQQQGSRQANGEQDWEVELHRGTL